MAGARRDGGGQLVRIGANADDPLVPRRRLRRFLPAIAIGAAVLISVTILVRASFDTDEPAQDRSAAGLARRQALGASSSPLPGPATGAPVPASRESPAPAGGASAVPNAPGAPAAGVHAARSVAGAVPPAAAGTGAAATAAASGQGRSPGGAGPAGGAPGPRSGAHPGAAVLASRDTPRSAGAAGRAGTSAAGAGGAGGGRAAETKLALAAEAGKRDAVWRRPPSEEDASSKLVARFAPSGGATLKGRVVDAESGRPSSGAAIEAHIGDAFMRTVSDSAGVFKMSGMLPGRKITVWIIGRSDTFVAERIDVTSPGEGETADAGVVRLLRGDELAAHLEGWMGVFVSRRGRRNVVAAVSPWSPADRAGIQVGDVLLSIEGRDVDGLGPRATGFLLRGPVGTKANIAVQSREGAVQRYQLERVLR